MASSKLLKERIESIQDTMKITNAMYLISSSKLRKARQNYQNVLPYFTRMRDTISRVVPHLPDEPEHPFFHERDLENPKRAYIVLTADKGMAGAYNQNLLKFLREHADQNDRFYVIGQVGYRALFRKDPRLVEDFHYGATAPTLQRARDITVDAIDDFKSGKLDEIYIVYTKIQNALSRSWNACCRWTVPTSRLLPRVWATPAARWRCSRMPGRCSSRRPPSICTA
jgi:F-type H+-transporting ATPase subunit gamma